MRSVIILGPTIALAAVVARVVTRNWGATSAEITAAYTGDALLSGQVDQTTYAVTVHAPAQMVWSWLVQIGQDRGGMYSYEFLENLFGLDIHNARGIRDEWQSLSVGDKVLVVPPGKFGMPDGYAFRVARIDPPSALILRQQPPEHPWDSTWAFLVVDTAPDRCRLISRSRTARRTGLVATVSRWAGTLMEPVIFLMTRKMLLGIKERAENAAAEAPVEFERGVGGTASTGEGSVASQADPLVDVHPLVSSSPR